MSENRIGALPNFSFDYFPKLSFLCEPLPRRTALLRLNCSNLASNQIPNITIASFGGAGISKLKTLFDRIVLAELFNAAAGI